MTFEEWQAAHEDDFRFLRDHEKRKAAWEAAVAATRAEEEALTQIGRLTVRLYEAHKRMEARGLTLRPSMCSPDPQAELWNAVVAYLEPQGEGQTGKVGADHGHCDNCGGSHAEETCVCLGGDSTDMHVVRYGGH